MLLNFNPFQLLQAPKKYGITSASLAAYVADYGIPDSSTSVTDREGYWGNVVKTLLGDELNTLNARKCAYSIWHGDRGGVKVLYLENMKSKIYAKDKQVSKN